MERRPVPEVPRPYDYDIRSLAGADERCALGSDTGLLRSRRRTRDRQPRTGSRDFQEVASIDAHTPPSSRVAPD